MHLVSFFTLALASITFANPIARGAADSTLQKRSGPTVQIPSGKIIGSTDSVVDSFKGIPYAQPPVGNLRLRPPQPIIGSLGVVDATGIPRACPQMVIPNLNTNQVITDALAQIENSPLFQTLTVTGEDCLTLNVQRPANTNSTSKLPVLVWIYGGGFEFGSTQTYDGTSLINKSIDLNAPFIFVAMNYRVNGFGFLASKELQAEGSTNLGLRDQRLALEWVQDNIGSFGGDPSRVTLWGESAGAISTFDHTIINNGNLNYKNGTLFRAAIMDSGSVIPADTVSGPKAQNVYNTVVAAAGCSSSTDTLSCLRAVDYGTLHLAINTLPGILSYRALDLAYLPRPDPSNSFFPVSPEKAMESGSMPKIPIIIGDQEDEGSLFSLIPSLNITTPSDLINYLTSYFPTNPNARAAVTGLVNTYPTATDPNDYGSPFRTDLLWNITPQFKRLAAILGDVSFTLARRVYLSHYVAAVAGSTTKLSKRFGGIRARRNGDVHIEARATVGVWSYLSTYLYGTPILGTFHGSDIPFAFGTLGPANVPTDSIQSYYVSFVTHLDPNALNAGSLINWPQWDDAGRALLNFGLLGNSVEKDNFREESYEYIKENTSAFQV